MSINNRCTFGGGGLFCLVGRPDALGRSLAITSFLLNFQPSLFKQRLPKILKRSRMKPVWGFFDLLEIIDRKEPQWSTDVTGGSPTGRGPLTRRVDVDGWKPEGTRAPDVTGGC